MRDYNETKFKELLPAKIRVDIHPSQDGGFFCEIKTFPGCFTQGENLFELMEMINDAVYTYLDIPQNILRVCRDITPPQKSSDFRRNYHYHHPTRKTQTRGDERRY